MSDIRCMTSPGPRQWGSGTSITLDVIADERAQLPQAIGVGSVSAADGQRALVDPDEVAPFEAAGRRDPAANRRRRPGRARCSCAAGSVARSAFPIAHRDQPRTSRRSRRRERRWNRASSADRAAADAPVAPGRSQDVDEAIVLVDGTREVRRRRVVQRLPLGRDRRLVDERVSHMFDEQPTCS